MKSGFFLDVVITESSSILELLSSEDKSLLIGRDTFLILDLGLDVFDSVCWFNIKSDGLSSQGFDEDLHTTSQSENQMESRFLLDIIVTEGSSILELLSSEDESLLIGWDTFLVLDLGLDIFNGVSWLNIKSDSLSSQGLDKDLHTTSQSEYQMKG